MIDEMRVVNLRKSAISSGDDMDLKLTEKVALVSGSTAGIGLAIAGSLAAEGAHVYVMDAHENAWNRQWPQSGHRLRERKWMALSRTSLAQPERRQ